MLASEQRLTYLSEGLSQAGSVYAEPTETESWPVSTNLPFPGDRGTDIIHWLNMCWCTNLKCLTIRSFIQFIIVVCMWGMHA